MFKNKPSTTIELLGWRADKHPEQTAFIFLGDDEEASLTYGELDRRAKAIAARLQSVGPKGDRALLLYPSGLDYITAFFGCLQAGVIAVPVFPPDPSRLNQSFPQLLAILKDAQPKIALTLSPIRSMIEPLMEHLPALKDFLWLATDTIESGIEKNWQDPNVMPQTLAFLQYTSGSTGTPKGVMIRQENLLANTELMTIKCEHTPNDKFVNWVPLYHNMGLLGCVMVPAYAGLPSILMSPLSFLQSPFRWLQAISCYQGTIAVGPNFAYDLCARTSTEEQRRVLDLRSWEVALSGGEPVRKETMDRFAETFEPCGFRRKAFAVSLGISEATLMVTGGQRGEPPVVKRIQAKALEKNQVIEAELSDPEARTLLSCGRSLPGQKIVIVNPKSLQSPPDEVGEIWVKGSSVAAGYWNQSEETEKTFRGRLSDTGEGPFLRTGDLGFLQDGELFLTGRLKEMIIIRGRNHYPQDIERTVEGSYPAFQSGLRAAFSTESGSEEKLVVVQEVDLPASEVEEVVGRIREVVSKNHRLQLHAVVLVKPGSLPKTRTGKVQRYACKAAFLAGELDRIGEWREGVTAKRRPPASKDRESWLISRISERLGVDADKIDTGKPLAHYGLDSLTAVELSQDIEEGLGVSVLISTLFESSSIRQMMEEILRTSSEAKPRATQEIDLNAEAVLDPSISFESLPAPSVREPTDIFLTGATGFLGAFLLKKLLQETTAKIHCLVRAADDTEGKKRIRKNLGFFSLWDDSQDERVIPVRGDLSKPLLGLAEPTFRKLASEIDVIYHNGASVNFIYPYRDLKASNVLGTQAVLRMAGQVKLKPVHYVSTLSVFPTAGHPEGKIFYEDDGLVYQEGLLNGYAQSKWVAEKLILQAGSRGLPTVIYRVGEVIGHSKTGHCQAIKDAYSNLLKGCIELGSAPDLNLTFYPVPVDFAIDALFYLSRQKSSLGKAFHLTNPEPIHSSQLFDLIAALGHPLRHLPYEEWLQEITKLAKKSPKNILASFLPFLEGRTVAGLSKAKNVLSMDCQNIRNALAGTSIRCPRPDLSLFTPYLSYLVQSGFLKMPSESPPSPSP